MPFRTPAGLLFVAIAALLPGWLWQDLQPGFWERTPLPQIGLATYYAPGMMERVRGWRDERGQLPACADCVGTVAMLRAGDIGRRVWLQPLGGELAGPFLVIDCAQTTDAPQLVAVNWVVDVSYELGQTWGMTGPLEDVIVWADPGDNSAVQPAAIATRLFVAPGELVISAPTTLPSTPQGGLPTRLPAPRATATPRLASGKPLVTTPTPPGYVPPSPAELSTGAPAAPEPPVDAGAGDGAAASGLTGSNTPAASLVGSAPGPRVFAAVSPGQVTLARAGAGVLGARVYPTSAPSIVAPEPAAAASRVDGQPDAASDRAPKVQPQAIDEGLLRRAWRALWRFLGGASR